MTEIKQRQKSVGVRLPLQSNFSDFDYSPSPGVILTFEFNSKGGLLQIWKTKTECFNI